MSSSPAQNAQELEVPQITPAAAVREGEKGKDEQQAHTLVNSPPTDADEVEDGQGEVVSLLDRLKNQMKKYEALLEYVPLDDIEITTQTEVPNTVPQMFEIGNALALDGSRLTLVACMATTGIMTKTNGGFPRLLLFGIDSSGLPDRRRFTARQVSKLDSLNATFSPANANPDTLNAVLKYVFLAKGAPLPEYVTFMGGFTRSLGQACRMYKHLATKSPAPTPNTTPGESGSSRTPVNEAASADREADTEAVANLDEDVEMIDGLPEVDDAVPPPADEPRKGDTATPSSPTKSIDEDTTLVDATDMLDGPLAFDKSFGSAVVSSPSASTLKRLRPLDLQDLDLHDRNNALLSHISKIKATQASTHSSQDSARVSLHVDQEVERKEMNGKHIAENQDLDAAHGRENADLQQKLDAEMQEQKMVAKELVRVRTSTSIEQVWAIVDDHREERQAKRRKLEQAEIKVAEIYSTKD